MAGRRHLYGLNHLHYLTTSTHRRARLFDSDRFKRNFITALGELRAELGFRIVGYVLMPDSNADITNRCLRHPRPPLSSLSG
jgi:REP element-mobilizing transposase RayT